ncbi:hypothetical protein EKD16_21430 [Streptomonospora litoralis]|uniref:Uncharacterized protein n=1 Tax=Streptomonospora litoralis TaxID=2498135 RepID=A0A4P6Q902_9ACTN|nr:hypothetical protein EKD16_21430 [Streptomonospora litoralis]
MHTAQPHRRSHRYVNVFTSVRAAARPHPGTAAPARRTGTEGNA